MGSLKPWDHAAGVLIHAEAGGFNAYTDSMEAYMPVPPHRGRALLMAPDRQNWKLLRELTSLSSIETSL
jgi:fructose-1,6-bisphosphatase/inositol monophosphatase family enzyme